jgi:FKBP-type peptidyl-prolyl cis-trans isomerase
VYRLIRTRICREGGREAREAERRLRQEQDREYQAAVQVDAERQRLADERRAAERAEADRQQQEAERQQREAEALARAQAEAAAQQRSRAQAKAATLPAEPPAGTPNTTRIALRLPDGKRLDRRFRVDEPVQVCLRRSPHGLPVPHTHTHTHTQTPNSGRYEWIDECALTRWCA